jgi:hypothetical protein
VTGGGRWGGRGARRGAAVVAVVLAALLLSACGGAVGSLLRADDALSQHGYQSPRVNPTAGYGPNNTNGVAVSASLAEPPTAGDLRQVAGIVWQDVRVRFDDVAITLHGGGQTTRATYTFAQLQQSFGSRDPAWNTTTLQTSVTHLGVEILLGFVALVAVVVIIAVGAVRRNRRRRPPPPPGGGGWPSREEPVAAGGPPPAGRWAPAPDGPWTRRRPPTNA